MLHGTPWRFQMRSDPGTSKLALDRRWNGVRGNTLDILTDTCPIAAQTDVVVKLLDAGFNQSHPPTQYSGRYSSGVRLQMSRFTSDQGC